MPYDVMVTTLQKAYQEWPGDPTVWVTHRGLEWETQDVHRRLVVDGTVDDTLLTLWYNSYIKERES